MNLPFQFDEAAHVYSVGGQIVPGCTRVLDLGGLVDYSMVPDYILNRKGDIGKAAHAATHYYDENELDWDTVSEEVKPRVDAWVDFRQKTGFVPRHIEARAVAVINGYKYGMTVDREGIWGREEVMIELKTCEQELPHHGVQLAGQMAGFPHKSCMTPLGRFFARTGYVVLLQKTGRCKVSRPYRNRADYDKFVTALATTWTKMEQVKNLDMEEIAA